VSAQPRRLALLIHLLLAEPRGLHSRDRLVALFWPEYDEQRARNALSQALHFIRRALGAEVVTNGAEDQLQIDRRLVWCDVIAFEEALTAERTAEALELYRGPFLDGFHISAAAAELDRWVDGERARLSRLYERALRTMAHDRELAGDFAGAVVWHRKLATHDPLSAKTALGLIRALATAGEPASAIQHARVHETLLREELGVPPDPAITAAVSDLRTRMASTPNGNDAPSTETGGSAAIRGPGPALEVVASAASGTPVTRRPHHGAMMAAAGVLVATLAFVLIANRKHADAATPRIDCVAVLPIENLSGDTTLEHFADAMTAATITALSEYGTPRVKSRPAILAFKGSRKPLPEIGRALECDGLIETSLTRSQTVAHIDVAILYAPADRHLWAASYEDDTTHLLPFERRVIDQVTLHVHNLAGDTAGVVSRSSRVYSPGYSAYLRGRDAFRSWNALSVRQAVALYKQAIALDSTFAPAFAGLADAYNLLGWQAYGPSSFLDTARTMAARALALDSASSEAHTTIAYILTADGDWTRAEREFKKAIALEPNNALAHQWYAVLLAILNRRDNALAEIRRARDLDPLSQEIQGKRVELESLAGVKARLGNPGRLQGWADPNHPAAWATRAIALARHRQCDSAYQASQTAEELAPDNTMILVGRVLVHHACKDFSRAHLLLAQLKRRPDASLMGVYIAMAHAAAGEGDSAFTWLDKSRWGPQTYFILRVNSYLDPLRGDPRFAQLLKRLRMP
jgi:DNA-binding SARP family transcriptional activator/TolB-like protein/Flp pilus assembly protein TadD